MNRTVNQEKHEMCNLILGTLIIFTGFYSMSSTNKRQKGFVLSMPSSSSLSSADTAIT